MLQGTRQTTAPKEKLRAGSPPRQPKPTGKAAEKLLARKKMLVLCDLPKRGDPRPVRAPLTGLRVDRCAVTRPALSVADPLALVGSRTVPGIPADG